MDFIYEDYYHDNKSLEETESWFQQVAVDGILKNKIKDKMI